MIFEAGYLTSLFSSFIISLVICLIISKWWRERNYPPGPIGLPILGYGLFLGSKPNEKLTELGKKYGSVFSFYLGPSRHICINDFDSAKKALTHPLALARPENAFKFVTGSAGFGGMSGEPWQEQRRFVFYTMRNLGLGKGLWETMTQESVAEFIEELRSLKGKPANIEGALTYSQAKNGISLLIGRHLDKEKDAANVKVISKSTRDFMDYFSSLTANVSFPALTKVLTFFRLGGYHKFYALLEKFEDIFKKELEERMKNPESLMKDDFIGFYYREMEKRKDEKHSFTTLTLIGNLIILFVAGNDSTLAGVSWLVLLMAEHQDIQKKVQDEIDSVLGRDGVASFDDRNKFPYTMAVILEMTRWACIAPLFPPRYVVDDFELKGYTIPKGSHIITNAWAVMRDPEIFEDPDDFKPERLLSPDGKKTVKGDGYLAFSLGKRNCPGEGVAVMTLFLYFVPIMQNFHVKAPPGVKADLEPKFGGAMLTKPQDLCFIER